MSSESLPPQCSLGSSPEKRMHKGHVEGHAKGFPMRSLPRVKDFLISPKSSTPLFFLQVGNDPLQFSAFFPFYRLQDLSWTLGLAHRGLPSERLAVLLDESMLVLPEVTKETYTKAHIWRWMSLDTEEVETMTVRLAAEPRLP